MFNVGRLAQILSDPKNWTDAYFYQFFNLDEPAQKHILDELLKNPKLADFQDRFRQYLDKLDQPIKGMIRLSDVEVKDVEFLIPQYIPKGGITIFAGAGGTGKTTAWCDFAAAITAGRFPFFVQPEMLPAELSKIKPQKPQSVAVFSGEDGVDRSIGKRLLAGGVDPGRLISLTRDATLDLKFDPQGLNTLERMIQTENLALVVFDPVQSFLPPIRMNDRLAMRNALDPLNVLGDKYGVSFLLIAHTNKTQGVYGCDRIAESTDMPNFARSVFLFGYTDTSKTMRYMSHEKVNDVPPGKTTLFTISDDRTPHFCGYSSKKDDDFIRGIESSRYSPAMDSGKGFVLEYLSDGKEHPVTELDAAAVANDISAGTLKRIKTDLVKDSRIKFHKSGFGGEFTVSLVSE